MMIRHRASFLILLTFLIVGTAGCWGWDWGSSLNQAGRLASSDDVGDWEKAATQYEDVIEDLLRAYGQLGYVRGKIGYELMARQQFNAAALHLKKAIEIYPNDSDLHLYLATCYANLSMTDRSKIALAEQEYEKVLELDSRSSRAEYGLAALLYYQIGNEQEATAHLERSLLLNDEDPDAYILMGRIKADEGETGSARVAYLRAYNLLTSVDPRLPQVAYSLGVLSAELGNYREAVSFLEEAVDMNPGMEGVRDQLERAKLALDAAP